MVNNMEHAPLRSRFANRFSFNLENATYAAAKIESVLEVVIAVPLNWSQQSRTQYCQAVRDSGFDVIGVITEPSAALLAYDIGIDEHESSNVFVVCFIPFYSIFFLMCQCSFFVSMC